jgi:predicted nucleic acid-binding protein
MILPDTSVAVAAFASWHERHDAAIAAIRRESPSLMGQVALETFAVLTRLPPPHRVRAELVIQFLTGNFSGAAVTLPGRAYLRVLSDVATAGLTGGAIYDAVVGATAAHAGGTLLTLDRRAASTYAAVGASIRLLAG